MAGAIGDIGSHAENLAATVTGLELESICADLTTFVPGRRLDDDGNMLLRFDGRRRGVLIASQIEVGLRERAAAARVRHAPARWTGARRSPNRLLHAPLDGPLRVLTRGSPGWAKRPGARPGCRPGHPEAFIEAFANVYLGVAAAHPRLAGGHASRAAASRLPAVEDGARGVRFIEKVVESAASQAKWTSMRD